MVINRYSSTVRVLAVLFVCSFFLVGGVLWLVLGHLVVRSFIPVRGSHGGRVSSKGNTGEGGREGCRSGFDDGKGILS